MLVHELGEVLVGVRPRRVLLQQVVEVGEHLRDGGPVLLGRALERLLHPGEALVEQLATEQVLDLLVGLAGLRGLPVVRRQLAHRCRGRRRQVVEHHLAEVAVLVGHRDVAGQLAALGEHGLVEQLAHLLHGAVEVVALQDVAAALRELALQLVEPGLVVAAAPQELAHRVLGRVAGHHVLPDGVERLGEVDRRGERVAAVVPREAAHRATSSFQLLAEPDVVGPRVAVRGPLDLLEAVRAVEGEGLLVAVDHLEPQLVALDERLDLAEQPAPDAEPLVVGVDVELPHHLAVAGDVREVAVGPRPGARSWRARRPARRARRRGGRCAPATSRTPRASTTRRASSGRTPHRSDRTSAARRRGRARRRPGCRPRCPAARGHQP